MAKDKQTDKAIEFRPAEPTDAKIASQLLFDTFPETATFIIGLGDETRAKKILEKIFAEPGHRLSYSFTEMVLNQGRVIGLFTSFPGRLLGKLDRRLGLLLARQYLLRGKIALFLRGYPLFFIKETTHQEYYLSNLAVRRHYRGQGIGAQVLTRVDEKAKGAHLAKVSLMVNINNKGARRFYERYGFTTKALHLESNKRVPYLGPGYLRMVKDLSQ